MNVVPSQYVVPYIVSNAVAIGLLLLAFWRTRWVRIASIGIFGWASLVNARIALFSPQDYQGFGELAALTVYRDFIHGWFAQHTTLFLLPIALCQLAIALLLLSRSHMHRRLAVAGATIFLLAICPLGVGSAFPFSLVYIAALLVQHRLERRDLSREEKRGQRPETRPARA